MTLVEIRDLLVPINRNPVTSRFFGVIDGAVGAAEGAFDGQFAGAVLGDADAGGNGNFLVVVNEYALAYELAQSLGDNDRALDICFGQQRHEFLAAPSAENIDRAQRVAAQRREALQGFIACRMAVGVVEFLEVVEVEHHDGERAVVTVGALAFLIGQRREFAAVEGAREGVCRGEAQQFILGFLVFADVADNGGIACLEDAEAGLDDENAGGEFAAVLAAAKNLARALRDRLGDFAGVAELLDHEVMLQVKALGQQNVQVLAQGFIRRIAKRALRALVEQDDVMMAVDRHNSILELFHDNGAGICQQLIFSKTKHIS